MMSNALILAAWLPQPMPTKEIKIQTGSWWQTKLSSPQITDHDVHITQMADTYNVILKIMYHYMYPWIPLVTITTLNSMVTINIMFHGYNGYHNNTFDRTITNKLMHHRVIIRINFALVKYPEAYTLFCESVVSTQLQIEICITWNRTNQTSESHISHIVSSH